MFCTKLYRCLKLFALVLLTLALCASATASSQSAAAASGPAVVHIDEFVSNLAGSGRHVVSFEVSLEVANPSAAAIVNTDRCRIQIKNEILITTSQTTYEDLSKAEGMLQFAETIKRTLNEVLPEAEGQPPVVHVLFDSFIVQ